MTTTSESDSKVREAAGTASEETRRVGNVASEEVQNVAGEAASQVRQLADEARTQVEEQSKNQRDRMTARLRTFSDDLASMQQQTGGQGLAGELVKMVSDRARQVSSQLEDREPGELLEDVRSFARRRPGTFLLGSLAAGVIAGRLLRGAKESHDVPDTTAHGGTIVPGHDSSQSSIPSTGPAVTGDGPAMTTSAVAPDGGLNTEPVGHVEPGIQGNTP
jgi:hypothetical protein